VNDTRAIDALTALVRTVELGVDARKSLTCGQITAISTWQARPEEVTVATCRVEALPLVGDRRPCFPADSVQMLKSLASRDGRRWESK
jgi:hypothetical protein